MSRPAILVEGLSKRYRIGGQRPTRSIRESLSRALTTPFRRRSSSEENTIWALRDVSFSVAPGEVVGVIGRNGAGKSTLLKVLSRITEPTSGRAIVNGRVGSLLEVGTGFHPELTGRENIFLNGAILGMRRAEIARKFDEIVAFAEVERFLDTPVKHYSSGMYLRLAFAVAAHLETEILLVDEVLAVGDAAFQEKCLGKMRDVSQGGRTVLLVSHNMQAIQQLCSRAVLLLGGSQVACGPAAESVAKYYRAAFRLDSPSGGHRPDTQAAALTSVGFTDSKGIARMKFSRSERIRICVEFEIRRPLDAFDMSVSIVHARGTPAFSECWSDQESPTALAVGHHFVELSFDLCYLKASECYTLTVYLHDSGKTVDFSESLPLPFLTDSASDPFKESQRWGLVRVPVRWHRGTYS